MVELGRDCAGFEATRGAVLENNDDHVVSDVSLTLQLLHVLRRVGQHSRNMVHDVKITIGCEVGVGARRIFHHVESATIFLPTFHFDFIAHELHKLSELLTTRLVGEHVVLVGLAFFAVDNAKFVGWDQETLFHVLQLFGDIRILDFEQLHALQRRNFVLKRLEGLGTRWREDFKVEIVRFGANKGLPNVTGASFGFLVLKKRYDKRSRLGSAHKVEVI